MKKILIIALFFCFYTNAQWTVMEKSGSVKIDTEPDAKPIPSINAPMWCISSTTSQYVLSNDNNMWKYELKDNRWLWQPNPPDNLGKRVESSYWTMGGTFYLFGGKDKTVDSNMWKYDITNRNFTTIHGPSPGKCYGNIYWTHEPSSRLFLWGGICNNAPNYKLFSFHTQSNTWSTITTTTNNPLPSPGVAVVGSSEDVAYIYMRDELWELDLQTFEWSQSPNANHPPGPNRTGMVIWRANQGDNLLLFGGQSGGKLYGDTWSYSTRTKTWTLLKDEGPTPRYGASYCHNNYNYLYMFGGTGEYTSNDVWQYGPFNVKNVIEMIEWKLDSATLMATWATALSAVILLLIIVIILLSCIRRCIAKRNAKQYGDPFIPINNSNKNYVIEENDDHDDF